MRFILPLLAALLALTHGAAAAPRPAWIDDAVVYGVAPQLAGPRGIADVTAHLDEIAGIGATVLWLTPITDAPPGDFGYAATDLFHLRASLGSAADLHRLVEAAHARGLRIILDMPVNDLSDRHPYYQDVLKRGRASPYYNFFARDSRGAVTHYFDWRNLENLNYANPAVRHYAISAFDHWLLDFNVDGFRVDAAWGPRQRAPDFWPQWSAALRRIKPAILLLAEAPERDPYYAKAGFDAAYDWGDRLGRRAWGDAFGEKRVARRLRRAIAAENDRHPIFRCLDDNDSGARFVSRYGPRVTRLAATMVMTLPGLPCLFMGDEVGAAFDPYRTTRPIDWRDDPHHLKGYFRKIIALRHREAALRSPRLELVETSDSDTVLAYLRPDTRADASLLVLLNYTRKPVTVSFPPQGRAAAALGARAVDLLNDESLSLDPAAPAVPLPALTARVLRQAPAR